MKNAPTVTATAAANLKNQNLYGEKKKKKEKMIPLTRSLATSLVLAPAVEEQEPTRCAAQLGDPCCSSLWSLAGRGRGRILPCRSKCGTRPCSRPTPRSWRDPGCREWMNPSLLHRNRESAADAVSCSWHVSSNQSGTQRRLQTCCLLVWARC